MGKWVQNLKGLSLMIVASAILLLLGVLYFMITIWTIKIGANLAGFRAVSGDWIILTAGIITAAAILGSAIQRD
jgi:hypothetical protein